MMKLSSVPAAALIAIAGIAGMTSSASAVIVPPLAGNTLTDTWTSAQFPSSGYPGFPGIGAWPAALKSNNGAAPDAEAATVNKPNAAHAAYPTGNTIYSGGFATIPNTLGAELVVSDVTPLASLVNIVFQIKIGEAYGNDFYVNANVEQHPTLTYYQNNSSTGTTVTAIPVLTAQVQNGTFDPGTGPEPVYINDWLYQWDLTGATNVTGFSIAYTQVQHGQTYGLRLDQSDVYVAAVPEPGMVGLLTMAAIATGLRRRCAIAG